jgi:predicted dehydrogenase
MMASINIGIIGYGLRGRVLRDANRSVDRLKITAVVETGAAARDNAQREIEGVRLFKRVEEMFDSGLVNGVLVETPPETHTSICVAALDRGLHVMSDVPAVNEIGEAGPLWEAADRAKSVYAFGATTNFWGFVDTCADLIRQGALGKPYYAEAEYVADIGWLTALTPWRKHFAPIRYCTHSLGPVLKWLGEELTEVACFSTGGQHHGDPGDDDAMTALFRTPEGTVVKLLTSFITSHPAPFHRYVLHGTAGYFEKTQPLAGGESQVLFSSRNTYGMHGLTKLPVAEARPEFQAAAGIGEHGGADYVMLANFADAIEGKAAPAVGIKDALRMTLPGLYALDSARHGGRLTKIIYPWD